MRLFRIFACVITLLLSMHYIEADYYSSISGLEKLLNLEALYIKSLENHIQKVEKFNKEIERFLVEVEVEQLKIQNDSTQYFEDPINAFKIIKRVSVDWEQMEDFTQQIQTINVFKESSSLLPDDDFMLPTEEDLKGASRGISRLQHIYKLKSEEIAEGQLGNSRYNTKLTSSDCYVLGQSLYESNDYVYASEWLIEAIQKLYDEDEYGIETFEDAPDHEGVEDQSDYEDDIQEKIDNAQHLSDHEKTAKNLDEVYLYPFVTNMRILEFLGAALYNAGNRRLAKVMNDKLLDLDPENAYGLTNKLIFENGVKEERRLRLVRNPHN